MAAKVVHFEIPFDDGERALAFYKGIFDWDIQSMPDMGYNMVSTGPTGDAGPDRARLHRRRDAGDGRTR